MPSRDTHHDCHCGQAIDVDRVAHCPRCGRSMAHHRASRRTRHVVPDMPASLVAL